MEVRPKDNFRLYVCYDDGASGDADLSAFAGRGVSAAWTESGVFDQVRLAEAGHPEWPGEIDLCPDALCLKATGIRPEEVFTSIRTSGATLFRKAEALEAPGSFPPLD